MRRTLPHDRPAETAKISSVARELGLPAETLENLTRAGVGTVAELREAGGSGQVLGAPGDRDLAQRLSLLDAHAALSVLPVGEATVTRLRDAGMRGVLDVAAANEDELRASLGPSAADDEVSAIRGAANAQAAVLTAAAAGVRTTSDRGSSVAQAVSALLSGTCDRDECTSALSPLAYLADLLDFAVRHLRQPITTAGLEGRYFADAAAPQPALTRADAAIDFDWGAAAPAPGLPVDGFSVTWSGWARSTVSETFTFRVEADDTTDVALWVDGALVIDPRETTAVARWGTMGLEADRAASLRLDYVDKTGPARVRLLWSSASQPQEVVPATRLSHRSASQALTLTALETRLRQPLRELPASCASVDDPVRRTRIAIEVLRAERPGLGTAPAYLLGAYQTLLEGIGTSYEELRRIARAKDRAAAALLCARIGVPVQRGGNDPDLTAELWLEDADLSEARLEELFGLRDTTRPPLDPAAEGALADWRRRALERAWTAEDWPATPGPDARPLIDPDLVGPLDLVDGRPSTSFPRAAQRPMDFYEDRRRWLDETNASVGFWRVEPGAGVEWILTDEIADGLGHVQVLGLGLGLTVADFADLADRRAAGADVKTELAGLRLDVDAFDAVAGMWRTLADGALSEPEWTALASILVQRRKRILFSTWRTEERNAGLSLSPTYFRLRSLANEEPGWLSTPFRGSDAARRDWADRLEARIDQRSAALEGLRAAVAGAEEAWLPVMRDGLVFALQLPNTWSQRRVTALSRRFQIDLQGGAGMTTRVAAAIESLQGLLHGARTGLLGEGDLELDDPARFDGAWEWLGSLATWRAAMRVFCYPETVLRPTLRRRRSPAMGDVIDDLRSQEPITPAVAAASADRYAAFFRDVCSLSFEAVAEFVPPAGGDDLDAGRPRFAIVARGAHSGALYACVQDARPDWSLQSGYGRTAWQALPGVPVESTTRGALGYRAPDGGGRVGLVTESRVAGVPRLLFSSFDGAVWRPPIDIDEPVVFCSANVADGRVPGAAAEDLGYQVAAGDQLVAADVDGDGRAELIAVAEALAADGTRPMVLLRELGGGLVVAWRGTIAGGWVMAGAEPVVLRTSLTGSSPRRGRERLLVSRATPGGTELGLLGARPDGSLALIATTNGATVLGVAGVNDWSVEANARFVAADLDGDGRHELVAVVGPRADLNSDAIVMSAGDGGFAVRANQVNGLVAATASRVAAIGDTIAPGRDVLLITTSEQSGDPLDHPPAVYALAWNAAASGLRFETVPGAFVTNATALSSDPEDQALPARGQAVFADDAWVTVNADASDGAPELLWTRPGDRLTMLLRLRGDATPQSRYLEILWRRATRFAAGAGTAEWVRALDDRFVGADLDGDGAQEIVAVRGDGSSIGVMRRGGDGQLTVARIASAAVRGPSGSSDAALAIGPGMRLIVADLDGDGCEEILVRRGSGLAVLRGTRPARSAAALGVHERYGPYGVREFDLIDRASPRWRDDRAAAIRGAYDADSAWPDDPDLLYLDEAYHDLPIELGVRLTDAGHFVEALDWLRSVYDYGEPAADRRIAYRLVLDARGDVSFARTARWLADPLDPHLIAATRAGSYNRFGILMIVRALLAYADSEFSRSTSESVPRADALYIRALELLDSPDLNYRDPLCDTIIGSLEIPIGDDEIAWLWVNIVDRMRRIDDVATVRDLADRLRTIGDPADVDGLGEILTLADAAVSRPANSLGTNLFRDAAAASDASVLLLADAGVAQAVTLAGARGGVRTPFVVPAPRPSFWVPPNPVAESLRRHARLARAKILAGRDVNGALVALGPYAAPTFADAGPELGAETLAAPRQSLKPLPYRYVTLVERAKQLVGLARELEGAMVAALEAAGERRYEELRARQDMALARSAVRIKDLQVTQAQDGARGAEIQRARASIQLAHYDSLIANGWSANEEAALGFQAAAAVLQASAAVSYVIQAWTPDGWMSFGSGPAASALTSAASASATLGGFASTYASLERRDEEWRLQQSLAANDVRAGQNQIRLAQDQVQIAVGERAVTGLQVDHAEEVLDFLVFRRFGAAERYEWVGGVLAGIYRFFLQQATGLAQLAEAQLAFERQSTLPAFIKDDYWQAPDRTASKQTTDPAAADSDHGVTGSARLLQDVVALDEYAFRTAQRKLQLSKTFSLARLDPVAFEGFRRTGILPFATPMELFDHDFPGHYLRLVQRVRASVLALVPAAQGIRATLATTGRSRVTLGADGFETVAVQRGPESVALSSAMNASGLFELDPQPEILAPFEGIGVDATWQLTMPRAANPFDYGTIADVLVTVDYTALDSVDLRARVIAGLDGRLTGARALSLCHDFPDAWYDLNNPELIEDPDRQMVVTVATTRGDFPPNVNDIRMADVAMLVTRRANSSAEVEFADLTYSADGFTATSGPMTTTSGLVGIRRGNAAALTPAIGHSPAGSWTLSFNFGAAQADAAIRGRFANDEIEDILLVITFRGTTPAWP